MWLYDLGILNEVDKIYENLLKIEPIAFDMLTYFRLTMGDHTLSLP